MLRAIGGNAVEAALEAAEQMRQSQQHQRKTLELEVEQATYEAHLASRRYEAVDPQNRLVAGELESRWNACLQKARELQARRARFSVRDRMPEAGPQPDSRNGRRLAPNPKCNRNYS